MKVSGSCSVIIQFLASAYFGGIMVSVCMRFETATREGAYHESIKDFGSNLTGLHTLTTLDHSPQQSTCRLPKYL